MILRRPQSCRIPLKVPGPIAMRASPRSVRLCVQRITADSSAGSTSFGKQRGHMGNAIFTRRKNQPMAQRSRRDQLQSLGLAGIATYGALNTIWYLSAYLFVSIWIMPASRGMGLKASSTQFAKRMSVVWASSQVTKVGRLAIAAAASPFVDAGAQALQQRLKLRSRAAALWVVIGCCLSTAAVLFGSTIIAWS